MGETTCHVMSFVFGEIDSCFDLDEIIDNRPTCWAENDKSDLAGQLLRLILLFGQRHGSIFLRGESNGTTSGFCHLLSPECNWAWANLL